MDTSGNRCRFFLVKKNRYCQFKTKPDAKYCGEHRFADTTSSTAETRRVPCPYDMSHTVDLRLLKRHMSSLCNARPPSARPPFTLPDCNVALLPPGYSEKPFAECGELWLQEGLARADIHLVVKPGELDYLGRTPELVRDPDQKTCVKSEQRLDQETVRRILHPVVASYLQSVSVPVSVSGENLSHLGLEELLEMVDTSKDFPTIAHTHPAVGDSDSYSSKRLAKHAAQQASLLGHLDQRGLLDPNSIFIEFGAGKGELSVHVHSAMPGSGDHDIFLVDRKNFRQKFAQKHQTFKRIYMDIRDLDLANIPELKSMARPVVAYSKHLCGAATDLTIRCLERYQQAGGTVAGMAIALCCHHRCKYSMYIGHEYLSRDPGWNSKQREDFIHLAAMSSWAINPPPIQNNEADVQQHYSGLSYRQRVRAGYAIKRFLDIGRLAYIQQNLGMTKSELVYYTQHAISPENLALFCLK